MRPVGLPPILTRKGERAIMINAVTAAEVALGGPIGAANPTPTVFVLDDDVSVRESLELLIQAEGWQPETFASAEVFLAGPRPLAPSCLVLDVRLPGVNGLDVQKLVSDRSDMPVIFITGHGDVSTTVRAM